MSIPKTQTPLTFHFSIEFINSFIGCLEELSSRKPGFRYIKPSNFKYEGNNITFSPIDLQEDPQCIAPEETGLLTDIPDLRAGFYRLGIVLYHLTTGQYPFYSQSPQDLVYIQVTKDPKPAKELNSKTPSALSLTIAKLLEKKPADRYQSYEGLIEDFREIADNPDIKNFVPAQKDTPSQLYFSNLLYGRGAELQQLTSALIESIKQKGIILISGEPGIGKTSIALSAFTHIVNDKALTATGKFEQLKRDAPYSGFSNIITSLIRAVVANGHDAIDSFKKDLFKACPNEINYLSLLCPEFEKIGGPIDKELNPTIIKPVLETALKAFLKTLSNRYHLILFADDLQWADPASIDLLSFITQESDINCSIIGAYRVNELSSFIATKIDSLRTNGFVQKEINLQRLKSQDLLEWIKDLTLLNTADSKILTDFIEKRTFGNPYFFRQFLQALEQHQCLIYTKGKWNFDIEKAELLDLPTDATALLLLQVNSLTEYEKQVLMAASVFGSVFNITLLKKLIEEADNLNEALHHCEQLSFIYPVYNNKNNDTITYKFAHDHLRNVFYTLMSNEQRERFHFKAGKHLEEIKVPVFEIADQYNNAPSYFNTSELRSQLATIGLEAGTKAIKNGAPQAALNYLNNADNLLSDDEWDSYYDLKLSIMMSKAEAEYLNSEYELMEAHCYQIIEHNPSAKHLLKIKELLILGFIAQGKMQEAINYGLETLASLGVSIPYSANKEDVEREFEHISKMINSKGPSEILNLPEITNWEMEAALRIVMHTGSAAYFVAQDIYPLLALKQVELSLIYGNSEVSVDAYTTYGLLLSAYAGDLAGGYAFGPLGIALREKLNAFHMEAKTANIFNGFIQHTKDPIEKTIEPLKSGFAAGMETGDIEYACYCLTFLFIHQLHTSSNYATIKPEQEKWLQVMKKLKNDQTLEMALPWHHLLLSLSSAEFDRQIAENYILQLKEGDNFIGKAYAIIAGLIYAVMFNDNNKAIAYGEQIPELLEHIAGIYTVPLWNFYYGIALAEQNKESETVNQFLSELEHRATFAPENYKHKYLLLSAIVKAQREFIPKEFEESCEIAEKSGIAIEAAFAYEKFGDYLLLNHKDTYASGAFVKSIKYYTQCGAENKVKAITEKIRKITGTIGLYSSNDLYMSAINEINKTILQEISIDALVQKLLTLTIKTTGANRALLLLNKDELYLAGEALEKEYIAHDILFSEYKNYPNEFIRWAIYTGEANAWYHDQSSILRGEDYFLSAKIKSAYVQPLKVENKVIGVLYMESDKASLFSDLSLRILKPSVIQIAISINNALLYDALQKKERALAKTVEEKEQLLSQLSTTKRQNILNIMHVEETEKQQLARELHDNLGQQMAALKLMVQNTTSNHSERVLQLIDDIASGLRKVAHNMMPKTLEEFGLAEAIETLVEPISNSTLNIEFDYFGEKRNRLPLALERALYRITQELISNIIKHSGATEAYIQLTINENIIRLLIEDNGKGIGTTREGIGLLNIKTRIEAFGGEFSMDNIEPQGTLSSIIINR
ncbi:MAG TPA: AAA family ATPase [Cytophagaceae bacterium]